MFYVTYTMVDRSSAIIRSLYFCEEFTDWQAALDRLAVLRKNPEMFCVRMS